MFGSPSIEYPEFYTPKPYSRSFVLHIDNWYAQSHPDEDFAETFAVWLNPRSEWRRRYQDWPALKKLEYMDELMRDIADRPPLVDKRRTVDPLHRIRRTLRQHYRTKAEHYAFDYPDFYDRDLRRLFPQPAEEARTRPGLTLHQPDPQGRAPHRLGVDRRVSIHDRSGPRGDGGALRRAAAAIRRRGRGSHPSRLHRRPHRADDELSAQRPASGGAVKKQRVLVLMHDYMVPPDDVSGHDLMTVAWKTEHDVLVTLREMGHDVLPLGVGDDLAVVRRTVQEWKPDIVFNMMEAFHELGTFDHNVVSYLELLRVPYTGCNPRGLMLARDKALSKTILHYHRIPVPDFAVVHIGRKVRPSKKLGFPVIVKSLTQEGSTGISQASVVDDESKLRERVRFIHDSIGTDAILERYIEGRELYVGIIGNARLTVFPVWELHFTKRGDEVHTSPPSA